MCDCKKKKEPVQISEPVIDEFKYPDTPDGQLAKELDNFYSEQHEKLMEQIKNEKRN
jgi:hypothetical protein